VDTRTFRHDPAGGRSQKLQHGYAKVQKKARKVPKFTKYWVCKKRATNTESA